MMEVVRLMVSFGALLMVVEGEVLDRSDAWGKVG